MKYTWTHHAASERLSERSGLTRSQIEEALNERRYVVGDIYRNQEHHLIWDSVRECLIDVPVTLGEERVIPSILPVTYGSNYTEWQRAEAERVWLGDGCYHKSSSLPNHKILAVAEVVFTKRWFNRSGWSRERDIVSVLNWFITESAAAEGGDEGVVALYRDLELCSTISSLLQEWKEEIEERIEGDELVVHIKKPGARRIVPVKFFLATP